jgi:hypothetical protein
MSIQSLLRAQVSIQLHAGYLCQSGAHSLSSIKVINVCMSIPNHQSKFYAGYQCPSIAHSGHKTSIKAFKACMSIQCPFTATLGTNVKPKPLHGRNKDLKSVRNTNIHPMSILVQTSIQNPCMAQMSIQSLFRNTSSVHALVKPIHGANVNSNLFWTQPSSWIPCWAQMSVQSPFRAQHHPSRHVCQSNALLLHTCYCIHVMPKPVLNTHITTKTALGTNVKPKPLHSNTADPKSVRNTNV